MPAEVLLRRPSAELPPGPREALAQRGAAAGVRFAPVQRATVDGAVGMALLLGLPAAAVMAGLVWLILQRPFSIPVLLIIGLVVAICFWIVAAQVLRVRSAAQRVRRQRDALRGDEGLYVTDEWLMFVYGADKTSLLPRAAIRRLLDVRVSYTRGPNAHCEIFPCAELHDERRVLLRLPPLAGRVELDELLAAWALPTATRRLDIGEGQIREFLLL